MVQSEGEPNTWYTLDMKTGFCTCARGINCAPCKHKHAISIHYNIADFSVVPTRDPCQQALYHYIATGITLEPHMYRQRGDISIPEIKKFIDEKLKKVSCAMMVDETDHDDLPAPDAEQPMSEDEDEEMEGEGDQVKEDFLKALSEYGQKVAGLQDPNSIKAMKAMTKTLKKSLTCTPHTLQNQMQNFGKGGAASRVSR